MVKPIKRLIACLVSLFMIVGIIICTTTVTDAMPAAVRVNYYRYTYKDYSNRDVSRHFRQMDIKRYKNRIYKVTSNSNIYNDYGNKIGYTAKGNYVIVHSNHVYNINGKNYFYVQKIQKINELYISDKPIRTDGTDTGFVRIENIGKVSGGQYIIGETSWGEDFNTQMPIYTVAVNHNITKVTKFWNIEPPKAG
jgi:hypothetical protein